MEPAKAPYTVTCDEIVAEVLGSGTLEAAEKNLLFRKEQLAFTDIHSPYDGLVIRPDRDAGDVRVPGASPSARP